MECKGQSHQNRKTYDQRMLDEKAASFKLPSTIPQAKVLMEAKVNHGGAALEWGERYYLEN